MAEDLTITLEPGADDMLDEEEETHEPVRGKLASAGKKVKGRGHDVMDVDREERYAGKGGVFESLEGEDVKPGAPLRSIEGWIIFVTGVQEEAQEDMIHDKFAEYGPLKNLHLNLDRRTGFVKGYSLIEYETKKEAEDAISKMNGAEFMGQTLHVDWAFSSGPLKTSKTSVPRRRTSPRRERRRF